MSISEPVTCDIIIPVWNQPELTRECLERLETCTDVPYRLILVDNGSDEPARGVMERARRGRPDRVRIMRNDDNRGFVVAVNQGLAVTSAPYVCLLNNDAFVTPGWLSGMIRAAESDPSIGLVNCEVDTYRSIVPPANLDETAPGENSGEVLDLDHTSGTCLLIKRRVIDVVGGLDEAYGMGHWEDNDYSRRAEEVGFRAVRALGVRVQHRLSASFDLIPGWQGGAFVNRDRFYARWGRPEVILVPVGSGTSWCRPDSKRILEVCRDLAGRHHKVFLMTPDVEQTECNPLLMRVGVRPHENIQARRVGTVFPGYPLRLVGWYYRMRRRWSRKGIGPWSWVENDFLRTSLERWRWFHGVDLVIRPDERIEGSTEIGR